MSLLKRASRNIGFKAVAEIFSRAIYLVFFIYLARVLGDELFGTFSFAFAFAGLFVILIDPGLNLLLTRDLAVDKNKAVEYGGVILAIKITLAIVSLLLCTSFIVALGYDRGTISIVVSVFVLLLFNALIDFQVAIFNAFERMEFDAILKITNKLLVSLFGGIALALGGGVLVVVNSMMVATAVSVLIGFTFIRKSFFSLRAAFDRRTAIQLMSVAFPIGLMMIFNAVYLRIDMLLMSQLGLSNEEMGWYAASSRLIEVFAVIPSLVAGGLFPMFSIFFRELIEKMRLVLERTCELLLVLVIPIVVAATFRADEVINLIYGDEYARSADVLRILLWTAVFMAPNLLLANLLIVMHRQSLNAYFAATAVVLNVTMNIILLPRYGFIGAGIATTATEIALFILYSYSVTKFIEGFSWKRAALKPVLGGFLMALLLFALQGYAARFSLTLSAFAYGVTILSLRTFSSSDIAMAKRYLKFL